MKADISKVQIGLIEIDGLLAEDGEFYVAVPQIALLFPYFKTDKNNASILLKRLMGEGFKTDKLKTKFNKNSTSAVTLTDFERVLTKLDRRGDKVAQELRDSMVGLSLHQLFSDAFGVKFEAADRQAWLVSRLRARKSYHPKLTAWLKCDGITTTYGTEVNNFKTALGLPLVNVEGYDQDQLDKLADGEAAYDALRKAGLSHSKALETIVK